MEWLRHFPTFHRQYHAVALWYSERDIFEKVIINAVAWVGLIYLLFVILFSAPIGYPTGAYIRVEDGAPLRSVAATFESRGIVNNALLFEAVTRILGNDRRIQSG